MKYPIPMPRPIQAQMPQQRQMQPNPLQQTPFAPAPQQNAMGKPPLMQRIANNHEAFLQMGLGMLSGRTGAEQFALGAQGFGNAVEGIKEKREADLTKNKTLQFLKTADPEIAAAVEAGALSASDAYKVHLQNKNGNGELDPYGFPKSGAISQKLRAYQLQGIDDEKALGLATGRYSASINPQTGERVIIDMASGQLVPLQQPERGTEQPQQQMAQNGNGQSAGLYDLADDATGVGSTLGNISSNTIGQIPGSIGEAATFPDQVKGQQEIKLFQRDLIRSLSLNPKFPVAEQKRIEGLLPNGAFTSPETLKQSLRSLDAELARIEAELSASVNDPNAPIQTRQQDGATLRGVQAARQRMGVPQGEAPQGQPATSGNLKQKYGLE